MTEYLYTHSIKQLNELYYIMPAKSEIMYAGGMLHINIKKKEKKNNTTNICANYMKIAKL